jgi:hypothetical protein
MIGSHEANQTEPNHKTFCIYILCKYAASTDVTVYKIFVIYSYNKKDFVCLVKNEEIHAAI